MISTAFEYAPKRESQGSGNRNRCKTPPKEGGSWRLQLEIELRFSVVGLGAEVGMFQSQKYLLGDSLRQGLKKSLTHLWKTIEKFIAANF